jgi:imidazolonepropionase
MNSSQSDLLITNARLATMNAGVGDDRDDPLGIIEDGALVISGGQIIWIGKTLDAPTADRFLDAQRTWITPGLIDCHSHVVYGGNRAGELALRLEGAGYEEIARAGGGIVSTVSATRAASEDQLIAQALPRVDALLSSGVTTLEIKSGYGLDTETECRMLRAAKRISAERRIEVVTTFLGAHALPPEFAGNADAYIDLVVNEMLPAVVDAGLADAVDAFCEGIAFSPDQVRRVFECARDLGVPVKLHAEQLSDLKGAVMAADFGALSVDHVEYMGQDGVDAMAASGSVAVILPGAFYYLHETQKPPIQALRDAEVPMAVATDANPGSSPVFSMLAAMNMACVLFQMTTTETLLGATVNGAHALGIYDRGKLATGMRADLACWDVGHVAELSYAMGATPLAWSMVDGHMVGA